MIDKTLKITAERLAPANATIVAERRVPHEQAALARALGEVLKQGAELVIVFGASAIADRRDVIPAALEAIGGQIEHFGMPVDPGNLLLIGNAAGHPVLGAPGCARSPKENGFDWVLMRLLAGLPVPREDITGMGVGGLLMEIVTRPQPRDEPVQPAAQYRRAGARRRPVEPHGRSEQAVGRDRRPAAGAHRRGGGARFAGAAGDRRDRPPARTGRSGAGRPAGRIRAQSRFRRRSWHLAQGRHRARCRRSRMASSSASATCRRSMPPMIDRLVDALDPDKGALIAVPTIDGQRGNPVVWSRRFFPELMAVEGDIGARHLIGRYTEAVVEVPLTGTAALTDVDTPEALEAVRAELEGTWLQDRR